MTSQTATGTVLGLTRFACEALLALTKDPFFWKLPILFMLVRDSERLLERPTMEGAGPPSRGFTEIMSPSLRPICTKVLRAEPRLICRQQWR